ncbi:hypothetical protein DFH06DRAFT_1173180 [Mycena polygramma]|nr:hypothetical protein DFH06DRAFT_1173180 [Mycena polygramma]
MDTKNLLSRFSCSPIRRLPSELLVEIFTSCWHSFTPAFDELDDDSTELKTELARLAHAPLLDVAQVCLTWHAIAMGTQSLWGDIQLHDVLWNTDNDMEIIMTLLRSALKRGGNSALDVMMSECWDSGRHLAALELIATHSDRWRSFSGTLILPDSSSISGKLSRLESLELITFDDESTALDMLRDMPSLKNVRIYGEISNADVLNLPLEQLLSVGIPEPHDLNILASLLPRLRRGTTFILDLCLMYDEPLILNLPPVRSDIECFTLQLSNCANLSECRQALRTVFSALSLPHLLIFEVGSTEYPHIPLAWPQTQFLSLCVRSSFNKHLRSLDITDVHLSESELIECLAALPKLRVLCISDHEIPREGIQQHIITDTLLGQLTPLIGAPCLVPGLKFVSFRSLLRFNDAVFMAFVLSRLPTPKTPADRFTLQLFSIHEHHREFESTVERQLHDLDTTRQDFSFYQVQLKSEEDRVR